MQKYIAFLRAINVGGHTVKMDRLRELFEQLGLWKVETFIASGNVIFESPEGDAGALERQIESHLKAALGYEVATFIRTPAEVASSAGYQPFPQAELDGNNLYISFLKTAPHAGIVEKVMALRTPLDDFHIHQRELYWLCRTSISQSAVSGALLEKSLGMPLTMRNSTTVRKLSAKYANSAGDEHRLH